MENPIRKTWKPTLAGILNITAGAFDLLGAMALIIAVSVVGTTNLFLERDFLPRMVSFINTILTLMSAYLVVVGILSIVGGIYAVQRKRWGLALAGSIAATLSDGVLGVFSIVLMALSKDEFD